jgi:hypothetical protein
LKTFQKLSLEKTARSSLRNGETPVFYGLFESPFFSQTDDIKSNHEDTYLANTLTDKSMYKVEKIGTSPLILTLQENFFSLWPNVYTKYKNKLNTKTNDYLSIQRSLENIRFIEAEL